MHKLSVIVPVYNEEKLVKISLEKLLAVNFPIDSEIIIVDDGSTDGTPEILKQIQKEYNNRIFVFRKENGGKGSAVRYGIKKASGDIITFNDADLEYSPEDLKKLLVILLGTNKDSVVYGSRFMNKNNLWKIPAHYIGNRLLSLLISLLYFRKIGDMETCYKMFYSESLNGISLMSNKFDIEPEITTKFLRKGLRIKEIPINYFPRDFNEGKKINYRDGIKALGVILKNRFVFKD